MFSDNQKKGLLLIILLVLVAGFAFHLYERFSPPPGGIIVKAGNEDKKEVKGQVSPVSSFLYVQLCGAVKNPGVYKVKKGTRLFEVVDMAGGLSPDADSRTVNLARVVEDGEKIYISSIKEPSNGASIGESGKGRTLEGKSRLINVNKASLEELEKLPGVGKTIAERIIEYREKNGPFRTAADLLKVKGIGEKKLEKIRDMISF
ncbi:MAG: ComEA family DNA-binding protein [Synergistetes bacterium]|nr:MAG: Competence protein ComEA helix-hairpin-helix repeat protein [bacterium 42_11]MBC7331322.1 ComEA family DNA-binding protein [Synergistota bacterium]MDK2871272.1 competence protein ComEA [bacterium]